MAAPSTTALAPYASALLPRPSRPPENPTWLDDIIQRAFGGLAPYKAPVQRVQLAVKGIESNLQMATVMRLLDEAVSKTK
jgi:hypothetical protein